MNIESENSYSLVLKIDKNGNEEWRMVLGPSVVHYVSSIKQTKDNGYIVSGWKNVDNEINNFVIKFDYNKKIAWAKLINKEEGCNKIQETSDGGYIGIGGRAVFKFDSEGNIGKSCIYEKDYEPEIVSNPFKVEVTDITKDIKMVPEPSFRSTSVNLSFYPRDIQVTTICSGE
jgi:hypothetical protein